MIRSSQSEYCRRYTRLFESSDGEVSDNVEASETPETVKDELKVAETSVEASAPPAAEESDPYPIDLPSPILLATSMVLAIAGTGSIFELMGEGDPKLGFGSTAAIAAASIPLALFLFYASILKATAETEEDDKNFMKEN